MPNFTTDNKLILSLRYLFFLCSFVGLSPHFVKENGQICINYKSTFKTLIILFLHVWSLIIIYTCFSINHYNHILKTIFQIQDLFWGSVTILVVFLEFVNKKCLESILKKIQKYDNKLKKLLVLYEISTFDKNINLVMVKILMLIFSTTFLSMFMDYFVYFEFVFTSFCLLFPYASFMLTLPFFVLKFVILNYVLTQKLENVNKIMKSLGYRTTNDVSKYKYKNQL